MSLLANNSEIIKLITMKNVGNIFKAALPVIIGVAGGMLLFEQIKKATNKA